MIILKKFQTALLVALMAMGFVSVSVASADSYVTATDLSTDSDPLDGARVKVSTKVKDGSTAVTMKVKDASVSETTTFGAHVHVGTCEQFNGGAAGPHYNDDGEVVNPMTEVWLDITVDTNGKDKVQSEVDFVVPEGGAQSIVIHALPTNDQGGAGARLACVDYVAVQN